MNSGLSGELRPVPGILPVVMRVAAAGRKAIIPAAAEADAATLLRSPDVLLAEHLGDACAWLQGVRELPAAKAAQPAKHVPAAAGPA